MCNGIDYCWCKGGRIDEEPWRENRWSYKAYDDSVRTGLPMVLEPQKGCPDEGEG